ncbi:hypothetical protein MPTK1_1g03770 [Marchantia polymorpha subsp. ruderalis]|uniref:Uncharacterized protein n=2 Tax=Marchantia polymorpha TaxID=3197 RepID=A0AAF6AL77_MARPO|nr:hypothetical protein MARPO_0005s0230 [Marchantia polymorpha]BBM97197.1 hypothetical protein Mp_1g03770 [Marchantia polymorpha subsp. ruderalis]|eukprot:PTQ48611.1 hypothetical protein MARPO_0005s0230 [Marchantia polymorpha]
MDGNNAVAISPLPIEESTWVPARSDIYLKQSSLEVYSPVEGQATFTDEVRLRYNQTIKQAKLQLVVW